MKPLRFTAHRILGTLPGSSRPLLVATDAGNFILKLVNSPEGPVALAAEWVGYGLARLIGLPTPDVVVVDLAPSLAREIDESELREAVERGAGACLGLREFPHARPALAREIAAADDEFAVPLLWLDLVIENPDRRPENPNLLAWGKTLIPIDFAASFAFHHDWRIDQSSAALNLHPRGHVFDDRRSRLRRHHDRLRKLVRREALEAICLTIPDEWLGRLAFESGERQRLAYAAFVWQRMQHLDRDLPP